MAAIKKELVDNLIKAQRQKGLSDTQIMNGLLKRKDSLGGNTKGLVSEFKRSGSSDPKADAAEFFGLDITKVKGNSQTGKGNKNATLLDKGVSYATSLGAGVGKVGAGLLQPIAIAGDTVNKGINSVLGTNLSTGAEAQVKADSRALGALADKKRLQANRTGFDAPKLVGEIAATAPAFMVGAGGATMTARAADQAVRGAAVGGLQLADSSDERLYNMAGGAIGGALGQAGGEVVGAGLSKVGTKLVNASKGRMKPKAQEISDLGKQYNVRTSAGDISKGSVTVRTETQLERVPVIGMVKFREGQHAEAIKASEKKLAELQGKMDSTAFKTIPKIEQAAQAGNRNAARVLGIVNDADDAGKILQASLEVKAFRQSQIASAKYDRVEEAVQASGNDIVAPTKTVSALDDAIAKQEASLAPDNTLLRELTEISENVADATKAKDFQNMRVLRSQLGDLAEKYGAPINGNKAAAKVFGDIRKAVDDDISDFATSAGGNIKRLYQEADKFYKGVMRGKEAAFAKAMKSSKPDEIYNAFIKTGKGDGAENFYNALDAKGQAALRFQMADTAASKAWNENREAFSPARFAGEFERLSEPYGRIFKGDDKKQMDGFVKLMRHVERAGQFKENPPTGIRANDLALAAGATATAMASPALAIGGASITALTKLLFTTNSGKNLLLAANKLPVAQQATLDNILATASRLAASAGSKSGRDKGGQVAKTKVRDDDALLSPRF